MRKTIVAGLAAATLLGGLGLAVSQAHEPGRHGPGMMRGFGPRLPPFCGERHADQVDFVLDRAETELSLTEAQRPLIDGLRTALHDGDAKLQPLCARLTDEREVTAPERLDFVDSALSTAREVVQGARPAFDTFYAGLDQRQKGRLDRALRMMHPRG